MKTKLLKRLRKRFQIWQEGDLYFPIDNDSLGEYDTYPYKYIPHRDLKTALVKRRELILKCVPKKVKIIL